MAIFGRMNQNERQPTRVPSSFEKTKSSGKRYARRIGFLYSGILRGSLWDSSWSFNHCFLHWRSTSVKSPVNLCLSLWKGPVMDMGFDVGSIFQLKSSWNHLKYLKATPELDLKNSVNMSDADEWWPRIDSTKWPIYFSVSNGVDSLSLLTIPFSRLGLCLI